MIKKFWLKKFVAIVLIMSIAINGNYWRVQASFTNSPSTNDVYLKKYERLIGGPLYELSRGYIDRCAIERRENNDTHIYVPSGNVQAIRFSGFINSLMNYIDVIFGSGLLNAITSCIIIKEDDLKQEVEKMKSVNEWILNLNKKLNNLPTDHTPTEDESQYVEIKFNENYIID